MMLQFLKSAAALAALSLLVPLATAQAPAPQAFAATYSVEWRGLKAATSTLQLQQTGPGQFTYASRNHARGLFSIAFPDEVAQTSELRIDAAGVRPMRFRGDDGSDSSKRDVTLDFDWQRNRVTGMAEDKPVDLKLPAGTQDPMSIQIALMVALAAGEQPKSFWMVDKDQLKEYLYEREADVRIKTVAGDFDTQVWASRRPNSNRVTRAWYAPSLGFVPVEAERTRDGKIEWRMRLRSLAK